MSDAYDEDHGQTESCLKKIRCKFDDFNIFVLNLMKSFRHLDHTKANCRFELCNIIFKLEKLIFIIK